MSRKVTSKGGYGLGSPYDLPGYEYDPIKDSFTDTQTGKTFSKDTAGTVALEANKTETIDASQYAAPVEITPSAGKDGMKKVTVTVSNIPNASDLEDNKAAAIDVSTYTEPVEVTPTQGKDGMKKVTVTLSNIPSGSSDSSVSFADLQNWYKTNKNIDFVKVYFSKNNQVTDTSISGTDLAIWTDRQLDENYSGTYNILIGFPAEYYSDLETLGIAGKLIYFSNVTLIPVDDGCGELMFVLQDTEGLSPTQMIRPDGNGTVSIPDSFEPGDWGIYIRTAAAN